MIRRFAPIALVAIVVGGAAYYLHEPEEPALSVRAAYSKAATYTLGEGASTSLPVEPDGRGIVHFATETAQLPVRKLTADASALVAEQATLQMLAQDTDLHLTPAQWSDLAAVTLHFQAIRHGYEATIAQPAQVQPGAYRIAIPSYPAAGDTLRAKFHAELQEKLGVTAAEQIVRQLAGRLEGHFAGFGVGTQTLEFQSEAGGADSEYQVTRTVQFWNSVEAKDRLTTRRETHFPGIEDPSGHTWGPFLAVLAASVERKS